MKANENFHVRRIRQQYLLQIPNFLIDGPRSSVLGELEERRLKSRILHRLYRELRVEERGKGCVEKERCEEAPMYEAKSRRYIPAALSFHLTDLF